MRVTIILVALLGLGSCRIYLPSIWRNDPIPTSPPITTPFPGEDNSIIEKKITYKWTPNERNNQVEEEEEDDTGEKKPFDSYAVLVNAVKIMEQKDATTLPPTKMSMREASWKEDNELFLWRVRQERRMKLLYRGNPHFDKRMELVEARRKARAEKGVMEPGYVDRTDPITRRHEQAMSYGGTPIQWVFIQWEGIQRRKAELAQALKEIEEEKEIEKDFQEWNREHEARAMRYYYFDAIEREKALKKGTYPMIEIKIDEEFDDNDGQMILEEMHLPPPPPNVIYSKTYTFPTTSYDATKKDPS